MRAGRPGVVWAALSVAILGGVVAACAGLSGDSRQAGYVHGCMSGYVDAHRGDTYSKDETLFRTDMVYRQGWEDGHSFCYEDGTRYTLGGPGGAGAG